MMTNQRQPARFEYCSGDSLMKALGVKYGVIVVSEGETNMVLSLEALVILIKIGVNEGVFQPKEEAGLKEAAKDLLSDDNAFFDKMRAFQLPPGFKPIVNFELCPGCDRNDVHGLIFLKGVLVGFAITSYEDGFSAIQRIRLLRSRPLDAIALMQQILATPNLGEPKVPDTSTGH